MIRILSFAILAGGIVLLVMGLNESNSFGSQVKEIFTGSPTDRSMTMIVAGVMMTIGGLAGIVFGGRKG